MIGNMLNVRELESLRTKEELENYFKTIGKSITEEEINELKKSYKQIEKSGNTLTLQQLDDVVGGIVVHMTLYNDKTIISKIDTSDNSGLWHVFIFYKSMPNIQTYDTANAEFIVNCIHNSNCDEKDLIHSPLIEIVKNGNQLRKYRLAKIALDIFHGGDVNTSYLSDKIDNKTEPFRRNIIMAILKQGYGINFETFKDLLNNRLEIRLDGSLIFTDTAGRENIFPLLPEWFMSSDSSKRPLVTGETHKVLTTETSTLPAEKQQTNTTNPNHMVAAIPDHTTLHKNSAPFSDSGSETKDDDVKPPPTKKANNSYSVILCPQNGEGKKEITAEEYSKLSNAYNLDELHKRLGKYKFR